MTIEAAKKICSVLGEVSVPNDPKIYDGGHFICVQVSIDLSLPLCCGRLISLVKEVNMHGLHSSTRGYLTYATGVGESLVMTKIVSCGLTMRVHSK